MFEESSEMAQIRKNIEGNHLSYLEYNRAEIQMAGGLREDNEKAYVGGLWVLEVIHRTRAIELIENDPYYLAFPRKYKLLFWGKAF